jgi:hypothetical protein
MSWKEPPTTEASADSVLLPAFASLGVGLFAVFFPPLALIAGMLAWWCWWKCRTDAAVCGFRMTIAALIVNHAMFFLWFLLVGAIVAGDFGVAMAIVVALVYGFGCTAMIGSTAWKYFISFACLCVVISSLLWNSIFSAREDARKNLAIDNLRQLGMSTQRTEEPQPNQQWWQHSSAWWGRP